MSGSFFHPWNIYLRLIILDSLLLNRKIDCGWSKTVELFSVNSNIITEKASLICLTF